MTTLHLTRRILSQRLLLRVLVNWQVMKLTMRRNYMRKMTKMCKLLVKKSDEISGLCGVMSIVGGHVGQNNNPLCDNVSSNFVGFTSHLALNYNPPLGPFCEYIVLYIFLYLNCYILILKSCLPIRVNELVCLVPFLWIGRYQFVFLQLQICFKQFIYFVWCLIQIWLLEFV